MALVERQGAVREPRSFRSHFIRAPLAFAQTLLPDTSPILQKSSLVSASTASLSNLVLSGSVSAVTSPTTSSKGGFAKFKKTSKSSANLDRIDFEAEHSVPAASPSYQQTQSSGQQVVINISEALAHPTIAGKQGNQDVRSQRWILFAKVRRYLFGLLLPSVKLKFLQRFIGVE